MANILGLVGYNKSGSSVNQLLAAFGNDIVNVSTGLGTGQTLSASNNVEFESYLDRVFFQNYNDRPRSYNGTAWTTTYLNRTPIAKYIKRYKTRLYLGNCKFTGPQSPNDVDGNALIFPSRVFYSDLFVGNNLTWGIEWGTNGKTYANTNIFEIAQPIVQDFIANNIKVGDPLFITSGNTQLATKPYYVSAINSNRLYVTEKFPVTATSLHFWVGSNWFDVNTDDNDQITGFGENSTRLLIFKLLSLHWYNGTQLQPVKDSVGTSSGRSIINSKGYTYYFHGSQPKLSGIYRYDGVSSVKVSRSIDPFIRGMSPSNYTSSVGWQEADELRWYIGDLTNTNYNISMTNAVSSFHTVTNAWDVSPISDVITVSGKFRTSNQEDVYCGTSDSQVLKMDSGNSFNTASISAILETKPYYPLGTETILTFTRIQVIGRQTKGIRVRYKLWDMPKTVDDYWWGAGELNNDKTELVLKEHNLASGIQLRFEDQGTAENDMYIEKVTIFYKYERVRI